MAKDERPDERQEEREFLAGLKTRTGRDLADWMGAIAAQGFHDKNEIIDWLRSQGLPFARASWLERIHRNGGKPIHGDAPGAPATDAGAAAADAAPSVASEAHRDEPRPAPATRPAAVAKVKEDAQPAAAGTAAELEKLVSTAKGYRPLYHLLEAQIRAAIPGVGFAAHGRYISVAAPGELAAVTLHPTEIRLGLALGDRPFDAVAQKAKLRGPGAGITHMVVLTDARQVTDVLMTLIRAAHQRVNGLG